MGNHMSCVWHEVGSSSDGTEIKVVDSEGRAKVLQEQHRVTAGELMGKHPDCVVCRANAFYIGQAIPVLSAQEELMMGHNYFLLPKRLCRSTLSAACLASLAGGRGEASAGVTVSSPLHGAAVRRVMAVEPFEIERSEDGRVQLRVSPEFIQKLLEGRRIGMDMASSKSDDDGVSSGLCTTPQLEKDYQQLVKGRAHSWKPRLETIHEKKKRLPFWMKRRRETML